ncbi:thioredoxin [Catenisphaera adipataccumulans]|nr:thioredoxin [Catenisphaera adipataccumulans]
MSYSHSVFSEQINIICVLDKKIIPCIINLSRQEVIDMEYTFTQENFSKEVLGSKQPVLIDFYADWCPPCKMMGPIVRKLADKYDGKVKIGKVNSDQQPELARQFGVMSIPNFVFIKDGKLVDQVVGAMPQHVLEQRIQNIL